MLPSSSSSSSAKMCFIIIIIIIIMFLTLSKQTLDIKPSASFPNVIVEGKGKERQ